MGYLLDTNVAIHLRDGDPAVVQRVRALDDAVMMSIVTRVELEGGVHRDPRYAAARRERLDLVLAAVPALAFDDADAAVHAEIVAAVGYSRRKLLDRMIAAQAVCHRATLVTFDVDDFREIPGLKLLAW